MHRKIYLRRNIPPLLFMYVFQLPVSRLGSHPNKYRQVEAESAKRFSIGIKQCFPPKAVNNFKPLPNYQNSSGTFSVTYHSYTRLWDPHLAFIEKLKKEKQHGLDQGVTQLQVHTRDRLITCTCPSPASQGRFPDSGHTSHTFVTLLSQIVEVQVFV